MGLRALIQRLEADADLARDLKELRSLGLSPEEIEGYRDFFLENYYINPLWRIHNEQ
jgi:hypothetical protein